MMEPPKNEDELEVNAPPPQPTVLDMIDWIFFASDPVPPSDADEQDEEPSEEQ